MKYRVSENDCRLFKEYRPIKSESGLRKGESESESESKGNIKNGPRFLKGRLEEGTNRPIHTAPLPDRKGDSYGGKWPA